MIKISKDKREQEETIFKITKSKDLIASNSISPHLSSKKVKDKIISPIIKKEHLNDQNDEAYQKKDETANGGPFEGNQTDLFNHILT